ncbi:PREDICTED: transcription factor Adf-1-like [Papilio polytes]|uniref:transcription factor Adf-1-like n=1 Tax=Papilio polytes TaxID=76194 RepID=UPI000676981D|nr:PREDICTED: transcription factor Adf-1-like [Papilio polytes]XP_013143181.1 PREDICTED: transcription factor Adf-1-like [Papilio polytes]XP_013143182.1 PREDICTED: transcription factor Adf-1-like [Papilio polytes]
MNEIDLIKEIEKHPILYDKSISGFNKTKLREDAWTAVRDSLNVSETECKKRWRSLRDSFIKLQRTHGGRTRWSYHHAMRFLLPHIEARCDTDVLRSTKKDTEDSDPEEEIKQRNSLLPDISFPAAEVNAKYDDDEDSQPSPKKQRLLSTDEEGCHCNRTDPDELFLLSCSSTLKRLNSKQNAAVRLKIQQLLYEAEFGTQMDMPYVTPASDCGYDALDVHE